MWRVTTAAALGFYRYVFIHEGARFVRMALGANGIAGGQGPYLPEGRRSVDVVAVTALDKAFVYSMVVRLREVSLRGCMAPIAQLGLRDCQQVLRFCRIVWRVTIQASHIAAGVG